MTRDMDSFYAGYCWALSAAIPEPESGTHTHYVEAVKAAGAKELLAFARRTDDSELPRIRQAIRVLSSRRKSTGREAKK